MINNVSFSKELDESFYSKIVIGNGEHGDVKDKGVVAAKTLKYKTYFIYFIYTWDKSKS